MDIVNLAKREYLKKPFFQTKNKILFAIANEVAKTGKVIVFIKKKEYSDLPYIDKVIKSFENDGFNVSGDDKRWKFEGWRYL